MYITLKKVIKTILPSSLVPKLEPVMRKWYSLLFSGNKVTCPICEKNFRKFLLIENKRDAICPRCGSLPRYRLLYMLLNKKHNLKKDKLSILHFSPSKALKNKLKKLENLNYVTCNFKSKTEDKDIDITKINEPDKVYDVVICFHVLEHIESDMSAMKELYRILKTNGVAYIQTPFKEGDIYENPKVTSAKERVVHFGQDDHVRVYSIKGLCDRLSAAGFRIKQLKARDIIDYSTIERNGIFPDDVILECKKE